MYKRQAGQSLADLKIGVNTFIDIIAQATGGAPDQIGSGSHIGIVSFADTAVQDTGLITSVAALKAVSYTHLDVYKRQAHRWGGAGPDPG